MYSIQRIDESEARTHFAAFLDLIDDAVNGGASIGFLRPLDRSLAKDYWEDVFAAIGRGTRLLLVASVGTEIVGSVQLDLCQKQNGIHRAEVQKLLVLTRYRRQGIAAALMHAVEKEAAAAARSLLFLDTEQRSEGEPFYESQQWIRCGSIPGYALSADGVPTANVIFFKAI